MDHKPILYILCPLANEAERNGDDTVYIKTGKNGETRIRDAVAWQQEKLPTAEVIWAFGAGTDIHHEAGPTLAALGEVTLRQYLPDAKTVVNHNDKHVYDTKEEIGWILAQCEIQFPERSVRVIFFTQRRHVPVAKEAWRLFYPRAAVAFQQTGQTKEITRFHQIRSFVKLYLVRLGLGKPIQFLRRRVKLKIDQV